MAEYSARFFQPERLEEVPAILAGLTYRSVILAGGTDLLIKLRDKRPEIDSWLSLCRLTELHAVSEEDGWLKIGSMVTHTTASEHETISARFHALSMACASVGSKQVRNKGTLGGSVMNASVASDIIPCLCLFHAQLEFLTQNGPERIDIRTYLENRRAWQDPQRLLTAIYLPLTDGMDSCFKKLGSRAEVTIAQISLCASWIGTESRKEQMRVVMGAVSPTPLIYDPAELLEDGTITPDKSLAFARRLRADIAQIRMNRKKPSKLKFTPAEQQYKERAVRGLLCDLAALINQR